jgi:DNA polymerase I
VLNARQKAIKVVTNACYGYAGWIGSRWYSRPVAEATTAWGRETIVNAIKLAEEVGLKMIYGDTDSIFVSYDPDKVRKFLDLARERVGLEVELDKLYKRVLFTEAKKRYAGLTPEGRLDVVGLEVVRGDWATIAKRIQEGVLRLVLEEKSREKAVEKAISLVRSCLSQLWNKQAPYADLVIWKALTKPLKEYAVRAPHVEAAKLLEKTGMKLTLGDKVGYVITKGPGKLLERAKPYIMASYDDIDLDYYANFQVIPAALRVLSIFGVTEQDLAS